MTEVTSTRLARDCEAVQVPSGRAVRLPAGTAVALTQSLGGTFTVAADGQLFRLAAADADALGLDVERVPGRAPPPATSLDVEPAAWEALKTCYDPEIPVNIVDLGLVYDLHFEDLGGGKRRACMKMTLTAPGCGMGGVIARDAQERLLGVPGIDDAEVEVVWDPPWDQSMISVEGRRVLGLG